MASVEGSKDRRTFSTFLCRDLAARTGCHGSGVRRPPGRPHVPGGVRAGRRLVEGSGHVPSGTRFDPEGEPLRGLSEFDLVGNVGEQDKQHVRVKKVPPLG